MPEETLDDVISKSSTWNNIQAESIARSFVASHPDDQAAWLWLLRCVSKNRNDRELLRMSLMACAQLSSPANFRYAAVSSMLKLGKTADAESFIIEHSDRHGITSIEALVWAELLLVKNREKAREIYSTIAGSAQDSLMVRSLASSLVYGNAVTGAPLRVAFLLLSDWHVWILKPIADALLEKGINAYFTDATWKLSIHNPEIIVSADVNPNVMLDIRQMCPESVVINTGHGVSVDGKNFGLYAACAADFLCVSNRYVASETSRLALLPGERILATGFPAMDNLFRSLKSNDYRFQKTVLFASTFNSEIGCLYLIGDDPVKAIRGDDESVKVILTAHPHLRSKDPQKIELLKKQAESYPNVEYLDSASENVIDRLGEIDVLVYDLTGVGTQFLATGRPMISLVDEQKARKSGAYAPDSTEWVIRRRAAITIDNKDDLRSAVELALQRAESGHYSKELNELRQWLFEGFDDGCAGRRIAEEIARMLPEQ